MPRHGPQVEARLMKQRPGTMRAVIAPKAAAVENFARGSAGRAPLAFSLLCSSVSAVAGYSGQVASAPASPPSHRTSARSLHPSSIQGSRNRLLRRHVTQAPCCMRMVPDVASPGCMSQECLGS